MFDSIAETIRLLRLAGHRVVLVTSGAVALGHGMLGLQGRQLPKSMTKVCKPLYWSARNFIAKQSTTGYCSYWPDKLDNAVGERPCQNESARSPSSPAQRCIVIQLCLLSDTNQEIVSIYTSYGFNTTVVTGSRHHTNHK